MNKIKVIVVNGVSRSGKNEFIDYMREKHQLLISHSTIDTIFKSLTQYGMIDKSKKGPKEREFLASVKQAWIEYNDGPFDEVKNLVSFLDERRKLTYNLKTTYLIVQVREPEEMQKLKDYFKEDFISILVVKDDVKPQHETDNHVNEWAYTYIVPNNGTLKDLEKQTDMIVRWIGGK